MPDREFDDFQPALNFPFRVRKDLAVLGRNDGGERVCALFAKPQEAVEDARAAQRRHSGPGRESALRRSDSGVGVGCACERDDANLFAGRRVEGGRLATACSESARAVNKVTYVSCHLGSSGERSVNSSSA